MSEVIHDIQAVANEFQNLVSYLNQWGDRVPGLGWCLLCGLRRVPPVFTLHREADGVRESFVIRAFPKTPQFSQIILPDSYATLNDFVNLLNKWSHYVPTLGWCPKCQTRKAMPWYSLETRAGVGDAHKIVAYPRTTKQGRVLMPSPRPNRKLWRPE